MGKGDIRSRRGKIVRGTFGNKRRKKRNKTPAGKKTDGDAQPSIKPTEFSGAMG